jgi:hypothetical protein
MYFFPISTCQISHSFVITTLFFNIYNFFRHVSFNIHGVWKNVCGTYQKASTGYEINLLSKSSTKHEICLTKVSLNSFNEIHVSKYYILNRQIPTTCRLLRLCSVDDIWMNKQEKLV